MNIWIGILIGVCAITLVASACAKNGHGEPINVLRHTMQDIEGNEVELSQYLGKVVMIVNVASKCGFTSQYEELETIFQEYRNKGFVILGFPSNDFLRQEPGTNEEIAAFCRLNYGVTFPMFAKVRVRGKDKAALYEDLTSKSTNPAHGGGIKWNFTKFLVNREGVVVDRFSPNTKPGDKQVLAAIEREL